MKRLIGYIVSIVMLASCSDLREPGGVAAATDEGTPLELTFGASFPEMSCGGSGSRAMSDEPTVNDLLDKLNVNLFVFDPSGVMLQFIEPKDISVEWIDEATKTVHFKVRNIYSSTLPRRLHFVVTSVADLRKEAGGEYIDAMASETTTLPALTVNSGTDAYWGAMYLKDGISENMNVRVKLIRNFVKLTVTSSATNTSKFKILGYTIVNRPNRGTVAPYIYRDHLFASFLDADNTLLDYDAIKSQGYHGVNPAGSDRDMTHTSEADVSQSLRESEALLARGLDSPYYIYERSQSSITSAGSDVKATYAIVLAEYNGEPTYYKIDIGRDKNGKFEFYDLLRNFQYTIDITEVGGAGAPTLLDAMNGAAHNNLSTSIVTKDLFSIGYLGDMIEVSSTRVIFTEKTADYSLRFRYTTGNSTGTFNPAALKLYDLNDETREFSVTSTSIDLSGDVISNASISRDGDWYVLNVTSRDIPTDSRRYEQNIRIYYSEGSVGLGRTVTFMLRRPWEFSGLAATTPATTLKSPLNVSFTLPSGLSKSLFPLILTFESDKQNIYAAPGTELTVSTAKSGFDGATTDNIMLYEWRMEWTDYSPADGVEGGAFTANFLMNTTAADDRTYATTGIDSRTNGSRTPNNGTSGCCIRLANKGLKYLEPVYVNVAR